MQIRSIKLFLAAIGFVVATSAQAVAALPYSALYIFGDSLSDSGNNSNVPAIGANPGQVISSNSYIPSQTYSAAPFGTYSNGPVWSSYFASMLGVSALPSLIPGGTNYAFGGARTTGGDVPSLTTQSQMYFGATGGSASSTALYVVAGGGNNARATLEKIGGGASAGSTIFNDANKYANDVGLIVDSLQAAGAQNIIVWNTPNLGASPASLASGSLGSFLGTLTADAMNAALSSRLAGEIGVKIFDVYGLASLPGASVFTNKTTACGFSGADCATSLFWDGIHPTTAAHSFIAQQMFALAVPEPSEIAMMLVGLLVVVGAARRRKITA